MTTEHKTLTLRDMILWAKDRALDDLNQFLVDIGDNYAGMTDEQRGFVRHVAMLLAMPDDDPATLAALSCNYWNGEKDTLFEEGGMPEGFVGFCTTPGRVPTTITPTMYVKGERS